MGNIFNGMPLPFRNKLSIIDQDDTYHTLYEKLIFLSETFNNQISKVVKLIGHLDSRNFTSLEYFLYDF